MVSATILVIGSFIGLYASAKEKDKKIIFWSLISSLSLPFFYYLKEDSIWLMPFVLMMTICTSITILIFKNHKFKTITSHLLWVFLPIFSLILVTCLYKNINYKHYGEYTITDRSGTYYKYFLHDLLVIQENEKGSSNIWISESAIKKAEQYSPTLKKYSSQINNSFTDYQSGQTKEYPGDIIFWKFRNIFNNLYAHKSGKQANNFYKKVHYELLRAFNTGKLKKSNRFYLSSVAQGLKFSDVTWFKNNTPEYLATMITYKYNRLNVNEATGTFNQILRMSQITHSPIIWPGTINTFFAKRSIKFVNFLQNYVTKFYQSTSELLFVTGFLGILLLLFDAFLQLLNRNFNLLSLAIIIISLLSSELALFIGVEWFSRFLSMKKFYDYISCDIPIMQILEILGFFFLFKRIFYFVRKA
ncbi:hypothetical protein [Liquorilactobacillus mali]|uniref:hypothetical protein n=1 Tax=Liquorilactobacillus mali TaxID=1618 RepID=UPI00024911E0|nr:hypothetical protein [Liquorilactobacillus mali]EJE99276.1 hypothetical protein LMA_06061 [Liquorilactobacillus mali KCTC 3596 = DSM 20444]